MCARSGVLGTELQQKVRGLESIWKEGLENCLMNQQALDNLMTETGFSEPRTSDLTDTEIGL